MKKESDLDGVKAIAKALLMTDICTTPYSPVIVQHPFTSTGFVVIPTEKHTGFQPIDITLNDENLKKWQDSMRRIIEKAENPYHVYMLLNPPYALTFLKLASPYLSKKDFSEILSSAWVMCEAPHNDPDVSKSDLIWSFSRFCSNSSLIDSSAFSIAKQTVFTSARVFDSENNRSRYNPFRSFYVLPGITQNKEIDLCYSMDETTVEEVVFAMYINMNIDINSVSVKDRNGNPITDFQQAVTSGAEFSANLVNGQKFSYKFPDIMLGDIDSNGEVDDWDSIVLNRYLAGWQTEANLAASDIDGDGELTDWDAIALERRLAGWNI